MPGIPFNTNHPFITQTNPLVCKYDFMERSQGVAQGVSIGLKSDLLANIVQDYGDYALLRQTDMGVGGSGINYGQGVGTTSGYNYGGKLYRVFAPENQAPIIKECTTYEMGNLIWPNYTGVNYNKTYQMVILSSITYTAYNSSNSFTNYVYSTARFTATGSTDDITCELYIDQISNTGLSYGNSSIIAVSITFYPQYGSCPPAWPTNSSGNVTTLPSTYSTSYTTGTLRFNSDSSSGTLKYVRFWDNNSYSWKTWLNPASGSVGLFNSQTSNPSTATNYYKLQIGSATFNGGSHRLFIRPAWYINS